MAKQRLIDSRMPQFHSLQADWDKWRMCFRGGVEFRNRYLTKFSNRETEEEFQSRRLITPVPAFAKSAILDIRNAIFERLVDIERRDGSEAYHHAVDGDEMGVDRRGSTMNAFMGRLVLDDLLVMGQVGVFIDAPAMPQQPTLADVGDFRPYLYMYKAEDILSYSCNLPDSPSEFRSVLLRDQALSYGDFGLPEKEFTRYRHLWIGPDNRVICQFLDDNDNPIDRYGNPGGPQVLELTRIPFVLMSLGDSMIKDVCEHQIALLNLGSSDVNYALKANFPFYTEQRDLRKVGGHLKRENPDGTATAGGQGASDAEIKTGVTHGRAYDKDTERPKFIHPSPEPLKASMDLQEKLEKDIRKLVNLAVQTLGRQSFDSKKLDNQGLANGLSFIGLTLEAAEKQIAQHWAAYEEAVPRRRRTARVKYPESYSLKTDSDRIDESERMTKIISKTPSRTAQKELWKTNISRLLGGHVKPATLSKIFNEIDKSKFTSSDPKTIEMAVEKGLCSEETGSMALGFEQDEHVKARADHTARILRIAEAQGVTNPAARGVPDLAVSDDAAAEKAASRDNTLRDKSTDRTRGEGKANDS